jgi:hypothetical protein
MDLTVCSNCSECNERSPEETELLFGDRDGDYYVCRKCVENGKAGWVPYGPDL